MPDPLRKPLTPFFVGPRFGKRLLHEPAEHLEMLHERLKVGPDLRHRTEVGDEERFRAPRLYPRNTVLPQLDVDVGRRCRRQHVSTIDADARRIANERDAARPIEIAHVMGCVAGRVCNVEGPSAHLELFAPLER